jgi:hypothetical protein
MTAGDFWWLHDRSKGMEIVDPASKRGATIPYDEIKKTTADSKDKVEYARISRDGKAVLLYFRNNRMDTFGVFETGTGKLLWAYSNRHIGFGTPLVSRTEVWAVEQENLTRPTTTPAGKPAARDKPATSPAQATGIAVALVRYAPSGQGDPPAGKREVIYKYSIQGAVRLGNFAPSPDGSHFVAAVSGEPPRLLFMPLAGGAKDVRVVELKER